MAQRAVLPAPCDDLVGGVVQRDSNMDVMAVGSVTLLTSVVSAPHIACLMVRRQGCGPTSLCSYIFDGLRPPDDGLGVRRLSVI